jgi:hypothetical protein
MLENQVNGRGQIEDVFEHFTGRIEEQLEKIEDSRCPGRDSN